MIIDEYDRNRQRVEATMTASIAQRFKLIRQDLIDYGGHDDAHAVDIIDDLSRQLPLVGAMTTRNFTDIRELLSAGRLLEATDEEERRVLQRGLDRSAPFHRGRNSVADALLTELYGTAIANVDLAADPHAFVTNNSDDFSQVAGHTREPHEDIRALFDSANSRYALGVGGLDAILREHFDEVIGEMFAETDFQEEPRRLDEIVGAEQELFDRIWYHRSLQADRRLEKERNEGELDQIRRIAGAGRERVEAEYKRSGMLGPYTDFELGMLNRKLSAVRWVAYLQFLQIGDLLGTITVLAFGITTGVGHAVAASRESATHAAVAQLGAPASPLPDLDALGLASVDKSEVRLLSRVGTSTYWAVAQGTDICLVLEDDSGFSSSGCTPIEEFNRQGVSLASFGSMAPTTEAYLIPAEVDTSSLSPDWEPKGDIVVRSQGTRLTHHIGLRQSLRQANG